MKPVKVDFRSLWLDTEPFLPCTYDPFVTMETGQYLRDFQVPRSDVCLSADLIAVSHQDFIDFIIDEAKDGVAYDFQIEGVARWQRCMRMKFGCTKVLLHHYGFDGDCVGGQECRSFAPDKCKEWFDLRLNDHGFRDILVPPALGEQIAAYVQKKEQENSTEPETCADEQPKEAETTASRQGQYQYVVVCYAVHDRCIASYDVSDTVPTEGTDATEPSVESTEIEPAEIKYNVLTAAAPLLPGDKLTAESFAMASLSEAEYRQACATMNVFTDKDVERLIGMECAQYAPAGQYIQYDDVVTDFSATNPWSRNSDRQSVVTLPITCNAENMASLMWGRYVDVEITVETTVSVPQAPQEPPAETDSSTEAATEPPAETTPGVEHYSATVESTVVETYKVQAAAIVDVLDADGNSLFADFCVLGSIPDAFRAEEMARRYPTLDAVNADIPHYICVAVPAEQAAVIDPLDTTRMKVTVSNPSPWVSNELQNDLYEQFNGVCTTYVKVWTSIQEEASQG